jgi:hypothetical protein
MKKFIVLLAALAATSAVVAGSAFAGGGTFTCTGTPDNPQVILDKTTASNFDVPAGTYCKIVHGEVTGTVTVEGQLDVYGAMDASTGYPVKFDKTLTVDGGSINVGNGGINVLGTMTIKNSAQNSNINTERGSSHIGGNLVFTNNTGHLWVGYGPTNVDGTFSWSGNTTLPSQTDYTQGSYYGSVNATHYSIS